MPLGDGSEMVPTSSDTQPRDGSVVPPPRRGGTSEPGTISETGLRALADLIRAALDDCEILLPPLTEQRLVDRVAELAALAGITIVAEPGDLPEPRIY